MRYSAPLAIVAAALAAGLTIVAVRALGPGVEAHPVTRLLAEHLGWIGCLTLSIVALGVGIRLLASLPSAEWGIRTVAAVKVADAVRDALLVATHPAVRHDAVGEALPALVAILGAGAVALVIVSGSPVSRQRVDRETVT